MNEQLIKNWNFVVGKNDWVYHLGDVAFHNDPAPFLKRLNGNIFVILGNHDSAKYLDQCVEDGIIVGWAHAKYKKWQGHRFYLSHYAHRVWRNSHKGSFHLYGHSHGDLEEEEWGRSMDVGVDVCDYVPVHVDWVANKLMKREENMHHHIPRKLEKHRW